MAMNPTPVPTLDDIAANPDRASELAPTTAAGLLVRLVGVQTVLLSRALADGKEGGGNTGEDRLLTVTEAATVLSQTEDWLYRHAKQLPFTVRVGNSLRFSSAGIAKWIRTRQGRP
jgi:predicted DNA-binding transcriptional regulator AlpA